MPPGWRRSPEAGAPFEVRCAAADSGTFDTARTRERELYGNQRRRQGEHRLERTEALRWAIPEDRTRSGRQAGSSRSGESSVLGEPVTPRRLLDLGPERHDTEPIPVGQDHAFADDHAGGEQASAAGPPGRDER